MTTAGQGSLEGGWSPQESHSDDSATGPVKSLGNQMKRVPGTIPGKFGHMCTWF